MEQYESDNLIPIDRKAYLMAEDTIEALRANFKTQGIFPEEVYPGYKEKNAKVKGNSWKSTGAAYDMLYFQIADASRDSLRIDFLYNKYMDFVDLGVGRGRSAGDVIRGSSAPHDVRYAKWNPKKGDTHRPSFALEFRHLASRIRKYFERRYMMQADFMILHGFRTEGF